MRQFCKRYSYSDWNTNGSQYNFCNHAFHPPMIVVNVTNIFVRATIFVVKVTNFFVSATTFVAKVPKFVVENPIFIVTLTTFVANATISNYNLCNFHC